LIQTGFYTSLKRESVFFQTVLDYGFIHKESRGSLKKFPGEGVSGSGDHWIMNEGPRSIWEGRVCHRRPEQWRPRGAIDKPRRSSRTPAAVQQKQNRVHRNVGRLHANSPMGFAWTREGWGRLAMAAPWFLSRRDPPGFGTQQDGSRLLVDGKESRRGVAKG